MKRKLLLIPLGLILALFVVLAANWIQLNQLIREKPLSRCAPSPAPRSMPDTLVLGVLAQEDWRFYLHSGVDWGEITTVLIGGLQGKPMRGASTLDMQVIKLCILETDQKPRSGPGLLWYKARQILAARILNLRTNKGEILGAYLMKAPLIPGEHQSPGFSAASSFYFKKPMLNLSFQEEWHLILTLRSLDRFNFHICPDFSRCLQPEISAALSRAMSRQTFLMNAYARQMSELDFVIRRI